MHNQIKNPLVLALISLFTLGTVKAQDSGSLYTRAGQQYMLFESQRENTDARATMYNNLLGAFTNYRKVLESPDGKTYEAEIKSKLRIVYPQLLAGGVYFSEQHNNAKALELISAYIDLPKMAAFRSEMLQRDPRYPQILHYAGVTAYNLKKYDYALGYFQEFLGSGSEENLKDIYVYMGMIYGAQKNYTAQEQIFESAIAKFPLSVDFMYNLVNVYIATQNMPKLLGTIDKITAIDPNDMKVLPIKARLLEGQNRNKESLEIYTRLYKLSPTPELLSGMARTNYNIATEIINEASNVADDTQYAVSKQQATPYLRDAKEQFIQILAGNPASKQYLTGLVGIYSSLDMVAEATVLNTLIDNGDNYTLFDSRLMAYNAANKNSSTTTTQASNIPRPDAPAKLVTTITEFTDANSNKVIDAGEAVAFTFSVVNQGQGEAYNLRIRMAEQQGLERFLDGAREIDGGHLKPGETKSYTMRYIVDRNMPTQLAKLDFYVFEGNGFDADPAQIIVNTLEYLMPKLTLSDFQFFADQGSAISLGDNGKLSIILQNQGAATAHNVKIDFKLPENVFANDQSSVVIDSLTPGAAKVLDYSFLVNKRFDKDSVTILLSVGEGSKTSFLNEALKVKVGEYLSAASSMRIEGEAMRRKVNVEEVRLSYKSELLNNVPVGSQNNNRYALIIGNEDYSMTGANAEINVPYAINDAIVFKEYCVRTFGIPENQVKLVPNATAGMMHEQLDWLVNIAATNPQAELIFYYSGHGNNDEGSKEPYLLPVDITGKNIRLGLSLNDLYSKLATNPVKNAYVFLDACFSGGYKSAAPIIAQKGVRVVPKSGLPQGNTLSLSSSSGDQTSSVYDQKKHGYYTYFLVKTLQEAAGEITLADLFNKTTLEVRKATALLGKPQEPQLSISPNIADGWQNTVLLTK